VEVLRHKFPAGVFSAVPPRGITGARDSEYILDEFLEMMAGEVE
jgi:hypothetical protein